MAQGRPREFYRGKRWELDVNLKVEADQHTVFELTLRGPDQFKIESRGCLFRSTFKFTPWGIVDREAPFGRYTVTALTAHNRKGMPIRMEFTPDPAFGFDVVEEPKSGPSPPLEVRDIR